MRKGRRKDYMGSGNRLTIIKNGRDGDAFSGRKRADRGQKGGAKKPVDNNVANCLMCIQVVLQRATAIFPKAMIAHDKGKPAARQGRKAVNLSGAGTLSGPAGKIVWLPKAIRRP
jgi:hypothetical protein